MNLNFRIYNKNTKEILTCPLNEINNYINKDNYKDFTIMRGTEIFDKNGIEIFEGDFCKNELEEYGCVSYSNGCFWLLYFDEPSKDSLYNLKNLTITGIKKFN